MLRFDVVHGSIPAHAGEPRAIAGFSRREWVYPRTCGGTAMAHVDAIHAHGLSPHMRGNRLAEPRAGCTRGSIPAHAGEPGRSSPAAGSPRVYPRTCGGTGVDGSLAGGEQGLSPHMRGNQDLTFGVTMTEGSIPAHAGEPGGRFEPCPSLRVYPRTCGGTYEDRHCPYPLEGLSPHMRGNRAATVLCNGIPGSIPAHAGEPHTPPLCPLSTQVYPRTCGGTSAAAKSLYSWSGLSPHMRGNQSQDPEHEPTMGSIPAHAGEPRPAPLARIIGGVYPRTCGGTATERVFLRDEYGLSPHMRGNP